MSDGGSPEPLQPPSAAAAAAGGDMRWAHGAAAPATCTVATTGTTTDNPAAAIASAVHAPVAPPAGKAAGSLARLYAQGLCCGARTLAPAHPAALHFASDSDALPVCVAVGWRNSQRGPLVLGSHNAWPLLGPGARTAGLLPATHPHRLRRSLSATRHVPPASPLLTLPCQPWLQPNPHHPYDSSCCWHADGRRL